MSPRPHLRPGEAGLTLMELLAAMAIFLGLAGMVLQVLGGGLDLWSTGESQRHTSESATVLLDRLENELRHVAGVDGGYGEPRIKLICDFIEQDPDGDGILDFRTQRLIFVREFTEERTHPALMKAGMQPGDGLWFQGQAQAARAAEAASFADDAELREEFEDVADFDQAVADAYFYRATEGLTEVAFVAYPDFQPGYEGRMVLWRALRSPVGGDDTLFDGLDEPTGIYPSNVPMEVVTRNLLYLGFEWIDGQVQDLSADVGVSGASWTWDSTRGILPAGEAPDSFRHGVGPASRTDPDDDVFPQAVRLLVVVTEGPDDSATAALAQPLDESTRGTSVALRGGRFLTDIVDGTPMLRVGHEWIEVSAASSGSMRVVSRGALGTVPAPHPAGTVVQGGTLFRRVVPLPVWREDLNRRRAGEARR